METLIKEGLSNQIILSQDFTGYCDWLGFDWTEMRTYSEERLQLGMYNEFGLDYVFKEYFPELLKRGISQEEIDQIMIENPKNILTPVS